MTQPASSVKALKEGG